MRGRTQSGGALILVLVLLSVLSVVAIESLRRAQIEVESAGVHVAGIQCRELCESGLRLAALLLDRDLDRNSHDAPSDLWATYFDDLDEDAAIRFETGEIHLEISPEDGRLPVSMLTTETGRRVMERLLTSPPYGLEQEPARRLAEAVRDWIDADEEGEFERSAYAAAESPYRPRNGPMESVDELLLVLGMPRELFHGAEGVPGLRELFTVHGSGKVNINTASPLILMALCPAGVDQATAAGLAQDMLAFRAAPENSGLLAAPDWYKTALGYENVTLPAELVSVRSDVFRVLVMAEAGAVRRTLRAVLGRANGQPAPDKPVSRVRLERKVLG